MLAKPVPVAPPKPVVRVLPALQLALVVAVLVARQRLPGVAAPASVLAKPVPVAPPKPVVRARLARPLMIQPWPVALPLRLAVAKPVVLPELAVHAPLARLVPA